MKRHFLSIGNYNKISISFVFQATKLLEYAPRGISRGTVTMLCNIATVNGQEAAAKVFYMQAAT